MPNINDSITWAVAKCNDPNVGYSQTYRDQQTVNGITYYDCSSFIWYALIAGGFDCVTAYGSTWPFTTDYMGSVLLALGFQTVSKTGELKPGDVCVRYGHTEMVYEGGNGTARTMGAHSSQYPLAKQVSINDYWTSGSSWDTIYRYGDGGQTQVLFGVDISEHNGDIDWNIAKDEVDFVIIRAGYGNNHLDAKLGRNIDACSLHGIPFGIYWFSYALSVQDCINEADACCNIINGYSLSYPVFYDWEYDSDNYYTSQTGTNATNQQRADFAHAFMDRIISNGYSAGLYANPDYIGDPNNPLYSPGKGFMFILSENQYMLWLAEWGVSQPRYDAPIWQYGQENINGFPTITDVNKTTGLNPTPTQDNRFKWWIYQRFLPF